jgi:ribonuclease J
MTELTFFGAAGTEERGELGGVQLLIKDNETKFLFDYGQRPDLTNSFYSFPSKPRPFEMLSIAEQLEFYAPIQGLFRHDLEYIRGNKPAELPLDGIIVSHAHYDHAGGLSLVRHDMPVYMHQHAQMILYLWQYMSGRTTNQFIDVIQQMSRAPKKHGKEKFVRGEEATLPRDIRLFKNEINFKIKDINITPYLVDHSLPGSCAFILETSDGKVAITGDYRLRGRRKQDTEGFLEAAKDVDFFLTEGSLLHFDHYGTEEDVTDIIAELSKDRDLVAVTYPPRDLDRILSIYNACAKTGRMLVIPPDQAKLLQAFNGVNGYPKLSNKYIGVLLKPKGKGLVDDEDFEDLIDADYYKWERPYLDFNKWDPKRCHESKPTRISLEDIADNQDKFLLYVYQSDMISFFSKIKPRKNSLYIRSHPAPWTKEMEVREDQLIYILKSFEIYHGQQKDCLVELYLEGRKRDLFSQGESIMRNVHQVHVTGHMNRKETREVIRSLNDKTVIIPYHSMNLRDFIDDVAKGRKIYIPILRQSFNLMECKKC